MKKIVFNSLKRVKKKQKVRKKNILIEKLTDILKSSFHFYLKKISYILKILFFIMILYYFSFKDKYFL